jgi:hypothetical protein
MFQSGGQFLKVKEKDLIAIFSFYKELLKKQLRNDSFALKSVDTGEEIFFFKF